MIPDRVLKDNGYTLRTRDEFRCRAFGTEKSFAKSSGLLRVKPCTGKNVQVRTTFFLGKVSGDGAGFNELYERIAGGYRILMSEVWNERLAVTFHLDYIVAEFPDEATNLRSG